MKTRSGFEKRLWEELVEELGDKVEYENPDRRLKYVQPSKPRTYNPDFTFKGSSVILEAKGKLTREERSKLLWIKKYNPEADIRLVFQRDNKLSKRAESIRYTDWARKHGIPCAVGKVPKEWIDEINNRAK